jgi:hypothetical protein
MKKYKISIIALLLSISLFGQTERCALLVNGGDSFTLLKNSISDGKSFEKSGYVLNVQFNIAISHSFGIGIGAGYSKYSSDVSLDKYYNTTAAFDNEGDNYEYRVYGSNLKENQLINFIEIPFLLVLQNQYHKKFKMSLGLGVKAMLPVQSHFKGTSGEIETRGFYPQYNVELSNMPNHGFDIFSIKNASGQLSTKVSYAAIMELGAKISLGKIYLTFCLSGTYGLSNIGVSKELFTADHGYQSLSSISSNYEAFSIGAKTGLAFPF